MARIYYNRDRIRDYHQTRTCGSDHRGRIGLGGSDQHFEKRLMKTLILIPIACLLSSCTGFHFGFNIPMSELEDLPIKIEVGK